MSEKSVVNVNTMLHSLARITIIKYLYDRQVPIEKQITFV
jgi:hypothetical protein